MLWNLKEFFCRDPKLRVTQLSTDCEWEKGGANVWRLLLARNDRNKIDCFVLAMTAKARHNHTLRMKERELIRHC